MNDQTKAKWEKHYHSCSSEYPLAAEVLLNNKHILPEYGTALDLACGRGANAICLAENNLETSAWDISSSALEQLLNHAKENNLIINIEQRDISKNPPETESFDVIVVSRFLDRNLIPKIKNAIKHNGLIFYQTYIIDKVDESGPSNPDYLLKHNELLSMFTNWKIIYYKEEGRIGDIKKGFRNQAMIIAQKTS